MGTLNFIHWCAKTQNIDGVAHQLNERSNTHEDQKESNVLVARLCNADYTLPYGIFAADRPDADGAVVAQQRASNYFTGGMDAL